MHEDFRGKSFVMQPMAALYRGADSRFGHVKGNGVICLTEDALIFEKITGEKILLSRADIAEARVEETFKGKPSFGSGGKHLVLRMKDGNRIGFLVRDAASWAEKFRVL